MKVECNYYYYYVITYLTTILGYASGSSWDPNTNGADFSTLTEGSAIGNTNPTGTYAFALESYQPSDTPKHKHKKRLFAFAKREQAAVTQISDGQILGQLNTADPPASTLNCVCSNVITYLATPNSDSSSDDSNSDPVVCDNSNSTASSTPGDSGAGQLSDGQVYAGFSSDTSSNDDGSLPSVCSSSASFSFYFDNGVIYDQDGRVGSIISNYQFQFDGAPPQAGTIYAASWSLTDDNYLALGDATVFYGCGQDDSYKIYWEKAYDSCIQVLIKVNILDDSC